MHFFVKELQVVVIDAKYDAISQTTKDNMMYHPQ